MVERSLTPSGLVWSLRLVSTYCLAHCSSLVWCFPTSRARLFRPKRSSKICKLDGMSRCHFVSTLNPRARPLTSLPAVPNSVHFTAMAEASVAHFRRSLAKGWEDRHGEKRARGGKKRARNGRRSSKRVSRPSTIMFYVHYRVRHAFLDCLFDVPLRE